MSYRWVEPRPHLPHDFVSRDEYDDLLRLYGRAREHIQELERLLAGQPACPTCHPSQYIPDNYRWCSRCLAYRASDHLCPAAQWCKPGTQDHQDAH